MGKINKPYTTEEFIVKAKDIHGDKYDYSLSKYVNSKINIKIICPLHGLTEQKSDNHFKGHGCKKCGHENGRILKSSSKLEFIERANKIHHNKYDYSLIEYTNNNTKVKIICPEHGIFEQRPTKHLIGQGCNDCGNIKISNKNGFNKDKFIENANLIHKFKYDYSLVNYLNANTDVEIICLKHGTFKQRPNHHTRGSCCPSCTNYLNEHKLYNSLKKVYIDIIHQFKSKWLKKQSLDMYLPECKIGIEYQGVQHFKETQKYGKNEFHKIKERDERKRLLCEANDVKLFYFTYTAKDVPVDYPHKVYTNEQELIKEIKKCLK